MMKIGVRPCKASPRSQSLHFSDQERGRKKQKEGGRQIGTVRNKERGREKKAKLRERAQPSNSSPSPQHDCRAVRLGIKTLAKVSGERGTPQERASRDKVALSPISQHSQALPVGTAGELQPVLRR
ncbi:unnamed protein product [Leuciscus chuanchicus]